MSFRNQWPKMAAINAKPRLGSGARFKALTGALRAKGAKSPAALSAWIGRQKYGTERFQKLASTGRRRAAAGNPLGAELLIFNPRRKSKMKLRIRRMNKRRHKHSPRRISYRGHRYYFIQLLQKFGKAKAKSIWRSKNKSKSRVGTHRSSRKALGGGRSWKSLVRQYGVMGAKKHYSRRR